MKHKRFWFWLVTLVIGSINILQGSTIREEFRKGFPFQEEGRIAVKNVNSSISVESWDRDSVEVFAEIEVKAGHRRDAEDFMKEVKILTDYRSGRLLVEPDYPKVRGGGDLLDWIFGRRKPQVKIRFWVKVPFKSDLDLKSVNGRVQVQDVKGRARLRTTNGRIQAEGIGGSVEASTVNGGIRVGLMKMDPENEVSLHTTNGSVKLYLPEDIKADVEASTVNGGIRTDFPLEIRVKFNSKRLKGRINGGGGIIDLHTINGSIRISKE